MVGLEGKLLTVVGRLENAFEQITPESWQTAPELMKDKIRHYGLRYTSVFPSNFAMYAVEKKKPVLYLGEREGNPFIGDMSYNVDKLNEGDYFMNRYEIAAAIGAAATLRVEMNSFRLTHYDEFTSYFTVDTAGFRSQNASRRVLTEKIYGSNGDFRKTMNWLNENGFKEVKVIMVNPEYVRQNSKCEFSRLTYFTSNHNFAMTIFNTRDGKCHSVRGIIKKKEKPAVLTAAQK